MIEASWLLRTSWIWSWITKGLLFRYPFIFRDCRHGAGIASTKDNKSKISFGEKFTRPWLHRKINWFFTVTKSPILTIPLLTKLWKKTDLLLIQINLLFQKNSVGNLFVRKSKYIVTGGRRAMRKTLKIFPVILRKVYRQLFMSKLQQNFPPTCFK